MAGQSADEKGGLMAEDYEDEFEGDPVLGTRLVCRGLEGGLRESVAVNDPTCYQRGDRVTLVVDAIVDTVSFPPHKPEDKDDGEEGVDRLHVTKLVTVAIVDRDLVAAQLEEQARKIAARRSEREAAKAAETERRRAERKAARAGTEPARLFSGDGQAEGEDDSDLTDAERRAKELLSA